MTQDDQHLSRRTFLKRTAALSLGTISARGIYELLDTLGVTTPPRVLAAPPSRLDEQYLVEGVEVTTDNGIPLFVPPIYTDVITANLAAHHPWRTAELVEAQARLEAALRRVEGPHRPTAAGLTIVVGWGLPFFRSYLPAALWEENLPVDLGLSTQMNTRQYAVLDAIRFPSDPDTLILEQNDVVFKFRSDSQTTIADAEQALFEDQTSKAYIGDLFDLTSKRVGFLGRGFGAISVAKQFALAAGVPGAERIPDTAQLMMGFTSTQQAALAPENVPSFETLPGITDQGPRTYFAGGCAMHLSHLFEDLNLWYTSFDYRARVARMFSPRTEVSSHAPVTLLNDSAQRSTSSDVRNDALTYGVLGHNATLQTATRLPADVTDVYGKLRKAGTPVPLREDFNTLDNPFAWSSRPAVDGWSATANTPGMHFVVFLPASQRFHTARLAMDGVLPDGTNLRQAPYNISDANNGINGFMRATHRQNFLVPPRKRRSFPLVEKLTVIAGQTNTPTVTSTSVSTPTPTNTPTESAMNTPTATSTLASTSTATSGPIATSTATSTSVSTPSNSTALPTNTPTATVVSTATATPTTTSNNPDDGNEPNQVFLPLVRR